MEITKEDFEDYKSVRDSGATNMFLINNVVELSDNLNKEKCLEIMKNFGDLEKKYKGDD